MCVLEREGKAEREKVGEREKMRQNQRERKEYSWGEKEKNNREKK